MKRSISAIIKKFRIPFRFSILIILIYLTHPVCSQNSVINGKITDKSSGESLLGVSIKLDEFSGTLSDNNGNYTLKLKEGKHQLVFTYVGYNEEKRTIYIQAGQEFTLNIALVTNTMLLDEVVVSATKFEQKLSDVTVSMEIIKPDIIDARNTSNIETAIQQIPGVMIMDGQASIRGGSGYSYGAGSRVLMLVDDLPMMTAASGEIKWDFVPMENIEQVEVIKGASSVLFGSSALNGVINVRTAYPRDKPEFKLIQHSGFYNYPQRDEIRWWSKDYQSFSGTQLSYSRKIGNLDISAGSNVFVDSGYRERDNEVRYRFNINTRYRNKKINGLSYGINTNYMEKKGQYFLLWLDGDSGVYRPSASFLQDFRNVRFNIDPYIVYLHNNMIRHSLKVRYFNTSNNNNTGQNNNDGLYFGEYQLQKYLQEKITWTSGVNISYGTSEAELYGNKKHQSSSMAIYSQLDKKTGRLSFSYGGRLEVYKLDEDEPESRPVFRSGINYQLRENTYLRTSFGQGYRYPTIAEKYTSTQVGALNIFPNPNLEAEEGWSSEIGLMQGFIMKNWNGIIDVAVFWTEYRNMIEYRFGQYYPDSIIKPSPFDFQNYTGFKSFNVGKARINGIDVTLSGKGKILNLPVIISGGYTYTNPVNLEPDSTSSTDKEILKYRFYHSAKADIDISIKGFRLGFSLDYFSYIINIDKAFEDTIRWPNGNPIIQSNGKPLMILPGLPEYRTAHHTGTVIFDLRLSYQFSESLKVAIVIKNLFNKEYMIRPGDVQAPRNVAFQYCLKF